MPNLLNYKYEIFPTRPQRAQLYRILRESKIQWNKAVTIRKKLKNALCSGQFEYVINTCLSTEKNNNQGQRVKAIQKICNQYPEMEFETAAHCYDTKTLVGKALGDMPLGKLLDIKYLAKELKSRHKKEVAERKEAIAKGVDRKNALKLTVFWQFMRSINKYAGYAAKIYMDRSFEPQDGASLSTVRFNISGSANSERWNTAVQPSSQQRKYGATGEPRYKRRCNGFSFQIQNREISDIFRNKRHNNGHQILINPLRKGNAWIDTAYHRQIPAGSKIKQLTINERAGHFFAVLSCEVPDSVWTIIPKRAGWWVGIDPGAQTALTLGLQNARTSETRQAAIHYQFLEKSDKILEKLQQNLARKQGPKRKRTETEIIETISQFSRKRSIQKLPEGEKDKVIAKEKERLGKTMISQDASNSWRRLSRMVGGLQYRVANQRLDVLHKISRALAEGCDVVGIGHWEPERQVSYRKKRKALLKQVKAGIEGAKEALNALEAEKSKQGPKGIKKVRRGGRDRSIATLRRMVEEKANRAEIIVYPDINEARSTMTCCNCGAVTGPTGKENLSVREWICNECNTIHQRDLNSAFNILTKTKKEYAAAQAAASATGRTMPTRTMAHGTTVQSGCDSTAGFRVRGSSGIGGSLFYQNTVLPDLWEGDAPKAFKSLIQMGIVRSLTMQGTAKDGAENPI